MERASKRQRQLSSDDESDSEGNEDWSPENNGLSAARRTGSSNDGGSASRSRRAGAGVSNSVSPVPDQAKRSIRLNVKAPSKLRNVIEPDPPRQRASLARNSKNKKPVYTDDTMNVGHSDEGEEEDQIDDEEEDDDDDDDNEGGSGQPSRDASSDDQSDGDNDGGTRHEEDDEDGDESMADALTPAPVSTIKLKPQPKTITSLAHGRKKSPQGTMGRQIKMKSTGQPEMDSTRDNTEDEELSEIGSQREDEEEEEEDEEEEEEEEEDDDDDEEEDDDDEEDGGQNLPNDTLDTIRAAHVGDEELSDSEVSSSRDATPDPTKLTRRQRGADDKGLMALSNEAQKKKFFTAEQITMRKAEMARRRKDLSEKRNEEEKADTLNRLLHKQAPKRRTRAQIMADAEREEFGTPGADEGEYFKPRPTFVRTVHSAKGTRVGVPEEMLGKPIGAVFNTVAPPQQNVKSQGGSRMVQVIE